MHIRFHRSGDLGYLPSMLSDGDPRPAKQQFHENFGHGGGWRPFGEGQFTLDDNLVLQYPGDPPLEPIAKITLRNEIITVYDCSIVCIRQPDGSFEVARMS